MLETAGCEAVRAANGNEGLRWARGRLPDLVLLQSELPDLSALELVRQIKRDWTVAPPRVVFMFSDMSGPKSLVQELLAAADGFIDNSDTDQEVLERIESLLPRERAANAKTQPETEEPPSANEQARAAHPTGAPEPAQHRRAAESWRESQAILRLVLDAIPVCVHWKNRESVYLGCNRRFARDAEVDSPEQIVGKTDFDLPWKCYADLYRSRDREVIRTGRALLEYEQPRVSSDGRRFWLRQSKLPLRDAAEGIIGILTVYEDITERKKAEAALQDAHQELEQAVRERTSELSIANLTLKTESEERLRAMGEIERLNADLERRASELAAANQSLQELDRLKSEFLATMSHELRTPLNSIIGFTGILRQGLAGPINPEQTKQLGIAYESARHLLSLINDLLDLSRIEAGKIELDATPFDFRGVVADVVAYLLPMAVQKRIGLLTDLPPDTIPMFGDQRRCFQVLLNLANNAVKFTERGEVRIRARAENEALRASVTDTGIGIKSEHVGMLFEAFRQVDGSAKRVYEGTGLGLHLCRKLLRLMRGEIFVTSTPGQGSCFSFTLPLRTPLHNRS